MALALFAIVAVLVWRQIILSSQVRKLEIEVLNHQRQLNPEPVRKGFTVLKAAA